MTACDFGASINSSNHFDTFSKDFVGTPTKNSFRNYVFEKLHTQVDIKSEFKTINPYNEALLNNHSLEQKKARNADLHDWVAIECDYNNFKSNKFVLDLGNNYYILLKTKILLCLNSSLQ